ncbi:hypothetical protein QZH41_006373 [Actinostola sp. cb2023]|nr:hypothetical protein QZH41_006373 [Actinostola sp. cb2023]
MFKKKKKDKQRGQTDKNQNNLVKENDTPTSSMIRDFEDDLDDTTDGFDENGFVDLQPIESDATVLGPRQRCMYVGTFAVVSGTDGRRTLKTHKERTSFVKDHLSTYRDVRNGVNVLLQMSSDGIKVFNADASRVRMAYPLQRISFATCDPDFCLFAFMTYSPTPEGVAIHGHVFFGDSSKQVQDLTAMIGKAFKLAFASSKLQKHPAGMNTGDILPNPEKPARRWAKHELHRGHDYSEHASHAKDKKKALQTKTSNSSGSGTDGSPVLERKIPTAKPGWRNGSPAATPPSQRKVKGLSFGSRFSGDDDSFSDSVSEMSISSTSTKEMSETKETSEAGVTISETSVETVSRSVSSLHKMPDASNNDSDGSSVEELPIPSTAPPLPPRNHVAVGRCQSDPIAGASSPSPSTMTEEFLREAGLGSTPAKVTYIGHDVDDISSKNRSDTLDRPATHHDEHWYMPGIPREFVIEMLQSSEDGSFFVRDSQSRPGCHALTVRVPNDLIPDGFANYLITPVPEGVKLEGFSKTFPDLMTLIEHYAQHADELPCKLTLAGSNMLCDNDDEDFTYIEPADPDYRLLSDFHSMMDELKH